MKAGFIPFFALVWYLLGLYVGVKIGTKRAARSTGEPTEPSLTIKPSETK